MSEARSGSPAVNKDQSDSLHVPVLIVGGGPAGLTTALWLGKQGIDFRLVDRRDFQAHYPRAHLLNVRTMEIFHDLGVANAIYDEGPKTDRWRNVAWYTTLAGPTPVHGRKIGDITAWGGGDQNERYASASPRRFANLPQSRLDTLLAEEADRRHPGKLLPHNELIGLESRPTGAIARIHDRKSGHEYQVHARYVVAADGGRTCSSLLGVEMYGAKNLVDVVSLQVRMDLTEYADPDALLTYFLNPDGEAPHRGALLSLNPQYLANDATHWNVSTRFSLNDPRSRDIEFVATRIRDMLGIPDLEMDVLSMSHWQYEGVVADRFRVASTFLMGDAAHRHPPTGGLGLNSAVQDAANLAWKFVAVLQEDASDSLLDTYESERLPVTAFNVDHSLRNAGRHAPIATAMGLTAGMPSGEGWREVEVWASDTLEGEKRRAAVAEAVAANKEDYSQLNVEAGFYYDSAGIIPDGSSLPEGHSSPTNFRSTARPGHHIPHIWLTRNDQAVSTVDLVAMDRVTLFVVDDFADAWRDAVKHVRQVKKLDIEVVSIGNKPESFQASSESFTETCEISTSGAVLVRPDKHVAWRIALLPSDPSAALSSALETILSPPSDNFRGEGRHRDQLNSIKEAGEKLRFGDNRESTMFTVTENP